MLKVTLIFLLTLSLYANETLDRADTLFEAEKYAEAHDIYEEIASKSDNSEAAYKLGWMYQKGEGVQQDTNISRKWYKKAATWDATDRDRAKAIEHYYASYDPLVGD